MSLKTRSLTMALAVMRRKKAAKIVEEIAQIPRLLSSLLICYFCEGFRTLLRAFKSSHFFLTYL